MSAHQTGASHFPNSHSALAMSSPRSLLRQLERRKANFGGDEPRAKAAVLDALQTAKLPSSRDVLRLHDALCCLAAYPDDARVLRQVRRMLRTFADREDLASVREELADSGVAGTDTFYRFYAPTARWLAEHWPGQLTIDWEEFEHGSQLDELLPQLVHYSETPGLDECSFKVREWIQRLKGPRETDAEFLIKRFAALKVDTFLWETLYNSLDVPLKLSSGGGPSRTAAWFPAGAVSYQKKPLERGRPDVPKAVRNRPESVVELSTRQGRRMVDLARSLMVAYSRELDAFSFASPRDVRLIHSGDGLAIALLGVEPERRLMLEAVYGYIILKNGVPIGYGTVSSLFGSSEIAFNIFTPFRGHEAGKTFVRLLAAVRHVFGSDSFTLFPYQVGQHNTEAIHSGAWWFYQKLGFRARDSGVLKLMERELSRMKRKDGYRSSPATLRQLAKSNVYLHLGRIRQDVIGLLPLSGVGLATSDYLAKRFGARRTPDLCVHEAGHLLGRDDVPRGSRGQRLAWERWGPLVLALPGVSEWPLPDRQALAKIIDAKGGRFESDFVALFDRHRRLRKAIRQLGEGADRTPARF